MDREYYVDLAKLRLERAKELLEDSHRSCLPEDLLNRQITGRFMQWKKALKHCWRKIEVATHTVKSKLVKAG